MPPEERDHLEDLKQSLYARNAPEVRTRRKMRLFGRSSELPTAWERKEDEREDPVLTTEYKEAHNMSFAIKMLIGSAVFCAIALGIGAYIFLNGSNLISANNIDIVISGPISVAAGTPVTLSITITNKNNVTLKAVALAVDFPAGTTRSDDTTVSLDSYKEALGDIAPGESLNRTVNAVIFGEQNLQKQIKASVTYGIAGSSSTFTKEQSYDILINSSPVVLTASSFKEITSGQPFDLTVNIKSNSPNTLKNVILKASYPFGFAFDSASIKPASSDNTAWALGDIPPGGARTLVIHGSLTGEQSDLRAFHYTLGIQSPGNPLMIGTPLADVENDVTIQKPFISLDVSVNNASSDSGIVGQFGRSSNVSVRWTNNLPETLSNVVITAHLSGSAYDKTKVLATGGYFRSATDDMIWNQQTNPELASVAAGDYGNLTFTITPADTGTPAAPAVNPKIDITASASADRTSASGVPGSTAGTVSTIKVSSNLSLSGRLLRNQGPFGNTGPIPPKAEQATTYTVVWTINNTSSPVKNAMVTATLPPYVSWAGQVSPSTEDVSYDKNSGVVTWNIGTIDAATAGGTNRREVAFQISFTPSVDQIDQSPMLVDRAVLSGTDSWSGAALSNTQNYLTTSFSTDPTFKSGDAIVVK